MSVQYVAYTWSGRKLQGVLELDSVEDAYQRLYGDDLIPYRVEQVRPRPSLAERYPSLFRPRPRDVIDFSRQMASLLKSGVPIRRSLATLLAESRALGMRTALRQVLRDIESGGRLSDAVDKHPTVFPAFYARLIHVGEATGSLVLTFQRLAETLQRRKQAQDKVKAALLYPAISLVVAVIAATILITYSLPSLINLLAEFGGDLPFTTQLLKDISEFLRSFFLPLLGSVAGVLVLLGLYTRTSGGARARDRLLLRLPVIGPVLVRSNMQSLTTTMKTLIDEGVPLVEAMRLSADSVGNLVIRDAVLAATEEASSGSSLSQAFRDQEIFPHLLTQGIVTGDTSGTLAETLGGLADFYQQESERSMAAATELIQPAIILVVAAVVGFVSIAIISGIYSTLQNVKP